MYYKKVICLYILLVNMGFSAEFSPSERQILVDFYQTTGGDNWINKDHWLEGNPCENQWHGVFCDNDLQQILLPDNNLVGFLPASFTQLTILSALDLSANKLTGNIPTTINQLSNLAFLNLAQNQFSGAIPNELGDLERLKVLDLNFNLIRGKLPESLGKLTQMEQMDLSGNLYKSGIPDSFGNLTNLTFLRLNQNLSKFCEKSHLSGLECKQNILILISFCYHSYIPQDMRNFKSVEFT